MQPLNSNPPGSQETVICLIPQSDKCLISRPLTYFLFCHTPPSCTFNRHVTRFFHLLSNHEWLIILCVLKFTSQELFLSCRSENYLNNCLSSPNEDHIKTMVLTYREVIVEC